MVSKRHEYIMSFVRIIIWMVQISGKWKDFMIKQTIIELDKYIEGCVDYKELTAMKMAEECNVSAATVSRYVKNLGYENFSHFRYNLIEKSLVGKNINPTSDKVLNKTKDINLSLNELKSFDFSQLKILSSKKVLVYYEAEFERIVDIFVNKMNLIHGNFIVIKSLSELEYLMKKYKGDCSILSIGNIPYMMYNEKYQYFVLKYREERKIEKRGNVIEINILNNYQGRKKTCITANGLLMYIALEVIAEEYTRQVLSKEQLDELLSYLT